MHALRSRPLCLLATAALALPALVATGQSEAERPSASAEDVVRELYDRVTFEAGSTPDWNRVRALFVPQAVVVLRTGRGELSVFSLDGFVDDFVQFIEQAGVRETGFTERVLGLRTFVYGDLAHVLVHFDSHIPGSGRPPHAGLDSFELVRLGEAWKIVSITNERPTADNPIPEHLFE